MIYNSHFIDFIEFCRVTIVLLLHWSWQALLLVLMGSAIARFTRFRAAELRHKIWLACLISVLSLPLWSFARWINPFFQNAEVFQFKGIPSTLLLLATDVNKIAAAEQAAGGWLDWLAITAFAGWVGGMVVYLVRFYLSNRKMRDILKTSAPLNKDLYEPDGKNESLSLPATLQLRTSPEISNPLLVGIFRPVILFPADIENWINPVELSAIIRHELAHLERRDHYIKILQAIIESLFFFHPAIRYALNQLSFERELACDEKVINSDGTSRGEYIETILKIADHAITYRESRSHLAFTSKNQLKRRISEIMNQHHRPLSVKLRFFVLAKTVVLFALVVWLISPIGDSGKSFAHNASGTTASNADEQTTEAFKQLYEKMREAILKGDKSAFAAFFADDYTAVSQSGSPMTKQQVIDSHMQKNPDLKLEKVDFSDLKVKTLKDTVVVTYLAEMGGTYSGKQFSHKVRITDIWEKRDGKWQSIASHASTIAQ